MHLALIVAVLAALTISEHAPEEPAANGLWLMLAAMVCLSLPPLTAWIISRCFTFSIQRNPANLEKWFARLVIWKKLHLALWLLVSLSVLYSLQWVQLVRYNWHLDQFILIDELVILLPVLVPLVASWAAFYQADRAAMYFPTQNPHRLPHVPLSQYLAAHIRHYFSLLLIPVLAMLAVQDLANWLAPGLMESRYAWLLTVPPLLLLIVLFPLLLKASWQCEPLPNGPLRNRLEKIAQRAGIRLQEIFIWQTNSQITNAAVTGFLPRWRYVFLTDNLLARFSEDQIKAIFSHELGHIQHRHLPLRLAALFAPLGLWTMLQIVAPAESFFLESFLAGLPWNSSLLASLVPLIGMIGYIALVLAWYSRMLEHQADLWACRAMSASVSDRQTPAQATQRMIDTLEGLSTVNHLSREKGSWLHPSTARRVDLLRYFADNPTAQHHYQLRLRMVGCLLIGIAAATLAWPWTLS